MKKTIFFCLFALTVFRVQAACDYNYGPCETPFLNPNVVLHFEGTVCTTPDAIGCNYLQVTIFDVYAAFDECYQEDCGVVWDEGYCADWCTIGLSPFQQRRKKELTKLNYSPKSFWNNLRNPLIFKATKTQETIVIKDRFWWKHSGRKV